MECCVKLRKQFLQLFVLILMIVLVKCEQEDVKVIINEMPESMKYVAIGKSIEALQQSNDYYNISSNLVKDFNTLYGPQWFCLVGLTGFIESLSHIDSTPNTLLWFTYNNLQVILFKLITINAQLKQGDIIENAKKLNVSDIQVIYNELNDEMKSAAILSALEAFKGNNNFKDISGHMAATFNDKYGKQWFCVIGNVYGDSVHETNFIRGNYIRFNVGEANVLLFKAKLEGMTVILFVDARTHVMQYIHFNIKVDHFSIIILSSNNFIQ